MRPAYLIDTDWVIHYLNGHSGIVKRLDELKERGLALSVVSLAEIYEGVFYSSDSEGNEADLNDFLRGVVVIGIDDGTCRVFGRERGRLRASRKIVGDLDLLIGCTALQHELTLLTNNRRHFELIEGLTIQSKWKPNHAAARPRRNSLCHPLPGPASAARNCRGRSRNGGLDRKPQGFRGRNVPCYLPCWEEESLSWRSPWRWNSSSHGIPRLWSSLRNRSDGFRSV